MFNHALKMKKHYKISSTMKSDYTVYDYFLMMSLISFLGFLLENIWISVRKGYVDNRNMNLPFLLGYGIAVMFIYFVLGVPDKSNAFLYCSICFIIVSLGEILLGTVVEKICGIHYWDYTSLPLHFTRYTSLFTSIGFSLIITGFMKYAFVPIMDSIHSHSSTSLNVFSVILIIALCIDFMASFYYMYKHQDFYHLWEHKSISENIRELIITR